jgi:hypothetical protein
MIKLMVVDESGNVPFPEVDHPTRSSLRGLRTIGGESLRGSFPDLTLVLKDGDEAPGGLVDYFVVGLLQVVSAKLKNVFEAVGAEFEYFTVEVIYEGRPAELEYFVANPLLRIAALDVASSDISFDEEIGDAIEIRKLVVDESRLKDARLAVIAELHTIAVQQSVADAVAMSGCTGCVFIDPDTVRK